MLGKFVLDLLGKSTSRLLHAKLKSVGVYIDCLQNQLKTEGDHETRNLLFEEIKRVKNSIPDEILESLPDISGSILMEIRAGVGGDEASLFSDEIAQMYTRLAHFKGWKVSAITNEYPMILFEGKGVDILHSEKGVHRVQRVPLSDKRARIHSSTITVAIFNPISDYGVQLNEHDLIIETKTSRGPGGQHANKTESAVRITHKPSKISILVQEDRSQHRNRTIGLQILQAKLNDMKRQQVNHDMDDNRRNQIGNAFRNQKIRTYNFKQNRVTDHRLGENFNLTDIMTNESCLFLLQEKIIFRTLEELVNKYIKMKK